MAYREVAVAEVREVLRLWAAGYGLRGIARLVGLDRKSVRRVIAAAEAAGVCRDGAGEIAEEALGEVVLRLRPGKPPGERGESWRALAARREVIARAIEDGLQLTTICSKLRREFGLAVPYRTLHRFCVSELGWRRPRATVRLADCAPGEECQVDFGRMGIIEDPSSARRRVVHALVFTAVYSRHMFIWFTHRQTLEDVIEDFEAAWAFFGGVFKVVIPDNLKPVITKADPLAPLIAPAFLEYAQARGFVIDATRVRHPQDKARVERSIRYVRASFFRGQTVRDLADCQRRGEAWCRTEAGLRVHRTTARRPAEVFETQERPALQPAPTAPYDLPIYVRAKVHRDHHIDVARALYSVPGSLIGERVDVRADRSLVRISYKGQLIKTHPRQPRGGRSIDPADLPAEKTAYAMRDLARLVRVAHSYGPSIGGYAEALLAGPLPWTKMRQCYRLLGLVRRYGAAPVEESCTRALEAEAVDVSLVARMVERALERKTPAPAPPGRGNVVPLRFARSKEEFRTGGKGDRYER